MVMAGTRAALNPCPFSLREKGCYLQKFLSLRERDIG
jgi:hypothetical protein